LIVFLDIIRRSVAHKSQFGTLSIGELVGLALASIVILLFISAIIYGIVKLFRGRKK